MAVRSSPRSRPISVLQPASSLATEKPVPCGSSNTSSRSCDTSIPPKHALSSSRPFLADAGSGPGNCAGMEETTGAPSSFAALSPRRLRASSRDGGGVVNRPPSPLTMLLSRHIRRRAVLTALAGAAACGLGARAQPAKRVGVVIQGGAHLAGVAGLREALQAARLTDVGVLVREGKGDLRVIETAARELEQGGVNVIVAFAVSVALAAQRSTSQVQIVFVSGSDP